MIISKNFLKEFLPRIDEHEGWISRVINAIEKSGIEVKRWEKIVSPTGLYYGVIKHIEAIKNSDKLNLCTVSVPFSRTKQVYSIVCGASNVRENLNVVVALPGAKLGRLEITRRLFKNFNIESEGMICGYSELYESRILDNSKDSNEGVIELWSRENINRVFNPRDLGLDDVVFDLIIPENRGDLYSAWGLAQEIRKNLLTWEELGIMMNNPGPYVNRIRELFESKGDYDDKWENPWDLKKLLLTNNVVCHKKIFENLNEYIYIAFNECIYPYKHFVISENKNRDLFKRLATLLLETWDPVLTERSKTNITYLLSYSWINVDFSSITRFLNLRGNYIKFLTNKLENFGYSFEHESKCKVPFWRSDINDQRCLEEELLRIVDIEENVGEEPINLLYENNEANEEILAIERIREFWRNNHFFECTTFNLRPKNLDTDSGVIEVINPISDNHVVYRNNALIELIGVLQKNLDSSEELHPVFEVVEIDKKWILNVVVPENYWNSHINNTRINYDIHDLRALIKKTIRLINNEIRFNDSTIAEDPFIVTNLISIEEASTRRNIGYLGFLKTNLQVRTWGFYLELPYESNTPNKSFRFSKYPPGHRDISLLINKESKEKKIGNIVDSLIRESRRISEILKDVNVIDKYEKEGEVTYTLRFKFQSYERTLSKEEINLLVDSLQKYLEGELFLKIR